MPKSKAITLTPAQAKSLINAVKSMRTSQKLAVSSKDIEVKNKHTINANKKARKVDSLIEKFSHS